MLCLLGSFGYLLHICVAERAYTVAGHAYTVAEHAYTVAEHAYTVAEHAYTVAGHAYTVAGHAYTVAEHAYTVAEQAYTVAERRPHTNQSAYTNTDMSRCTQPRLCWRQPSCTERPRRISKNAYAQRIEHKDKSYNEKM
jgi:hypothetical protein